MSLPTAVHYISFVIGIVTISIGIAAVLKPEPMSKNFGISVSGPALHYVVSTGARDIFMGLTIFILSYRQEWGILGAINLCVGIVAISDFLVVIKNGNKKAAMAHLFGAIAIVGYGIWLILMDPL